MKIEFSSWVNFWLIVGLLIYCLYIHASLLRLKDEVTCYMILSELKGKVTKHGK